MSNISPDFGEAKLRMVAEKTALEKRFMIQDITDGTQTLLQVSKINRLIYADGVMKKILVQGDAADSLKLSRVGDGATGASDANYKPGRDVFEVKEFGAGSDNIPTRDWYHIISMQGNDIRGDYVMQLAVGMTTGALYYRRFYTGTWGAWHKILLEGDVSHFQPGEVFQINDTVSFNGYISDASRAIIVTFVLPKSAKGVSVSVECNNLKVRGNKTYLINNEDLSNYDFKILQTYENIVTAHIKHKDASALSDENNIALSVCGGFKFTFS